ncbi:hypothetical protein EIP86_005027 [Pleurotus ostreatoroseus]|nr:hypothetical protein EIP86_005027 [Pleurotus ostreatoroseus]
MAIVKSTNTASGKRKRDDRDEHHAHDDPPPKPKKAKVTEQTTHNKKQKSSNTAKSKKADSKELQATPDEFADGFFYCHQCSKKRPVSLGLRCTVLRDGSKGRSSRCPVKYCKACLRNRYNVDIEDLKANSSPSDASSSKKQRERHVSDEDYTFKRVAQLLGSELIINRYRGEQPLGNFSYKARKAEKAADGNDKNGESSSTVKKGKGPKAAQSPTESSSTGKMAKPRAKPKSPVKPKPMPRPTWTHVPTPITLADAESRIAIREFVWRFSDLLQISNSHIDELDELSGESLGFSEDWEDGDDESVELYAWVSELCAKSIILGLVEILVGHAESKNAYAEAAAAKEAAKAIKGSGANLSRVWAALVKLRESNSDLSFRSPIPPPTTTVFRHTRSGTQNSTDAVHIGSSAQMVPVIEDLIENVIETSPVREALEAGTTQEKEFAKEVKEAIVTENANWKARTETKDKASRQRHNLTLKDLEYSGQLAALHHSPRFLPLGRDSDGRIYYALNPGAGELEAAQQLVRGHDGRVRIGRRRGPWTEDDRRELQKWSWFVAVWGKKPEDAKLAKHDEDEDEHEFDYEETWWGFWQPNEILTLAEWISRKADLDEEPLEKGKSARANGSSARSTNGSTKGKGSRTVSTSSSLTSLTSSKSSKSARGLSPLSNLSSEEVDEDAEMDDSNRQGPPVTHELHGLVKGLREYAEMLQWRIGRVNHDREDSEGLSTTS